MSDDSGHNPSSDAATAFGPTPDASHVQEVVRRLVNAFDPLRIVVFGSYAPEEARSVYSKEVSYT